ncbi:hypothetical protein ACVWXM_006291 [Bradyrhizobium sp. GM7.3]
MGAPAKKADPELPAEIAAAMQSAGFSPELPILKQIIANFAAAKGEAKSATTGAQPPVRMWPMQALLPVRVSYQKALRAANSGQLGATKIGGRWFCTSRAMECWLAKTGQDNR